MKWGFVNSDWSVEFSQVFKWVVTLYDSRARNNNTQNLFTLVVPNGTQGRSDRSQLTHFAV